MAASLKSIRCAMNSNSSRKLHFTVSSLYYRANAIQNYATATAILPDSNRYKIFAGLVVERRPVITAELNAIEKKYQKLQAALELAKSSPSNHELRHQADLDLARRRLSEDHEDTEAEATLLTAVDLEDAWSDEKNAFKFASRTTEADKTGSKLTNQRKLDRSLYLLVKQKFWDNAFWVFPEALVEEQESLRETCERTLTTLNCELSVVFSGNAPVAFHKVNYPKSTITDENAYKGAKIFLHKVSLLDGDVTRLEDEQTYTDFCWATSDEVKELVDKSYWKSVRAILHNY